MTDLDLTPRGAQPDQTGTRSWRNVAIISALLAVAGFMVYQALTSARVYYLNVDEAVAQQTELGDDEFMMQGVVAGEPSSADDGALIFTVAFGSETAQVRHVGPEPTDLFKDGEKVLSKGRWQNGIFQSEQLIVKHSEEYIEDNPARLDYEIDNTDTESDNTELDNTELDDTVSDASGSSQSE